MLDESPQRFIVSVRASARRDASSRLSTRRQMKRRQQEAYDRRLDEMSARCGGSAHMQIKDTTPRFEQLAPSVDASHPGVVAVAPASSRPDTYRRTSRPMSANLCGKANTYPYAGRLNEHRALVERLILQPLAETPRALTYEGGLAC
jgi:hypothetical protein